MAGVKRPAGRQPQGMCSRKADQKLAWLQVQAERIQALSKENATLIEELKRLQSRSVCNKPDY